MKYSNVIVSGLCMSMVSLATAAPTEVPSDEPVTLRIISSMATRQFLTEVIAQLRNNQIPGRARVSGRSGCH